MLWLPFPPELTTYTYTQKMRRFAPATTVLQLIAASVPMMAMGSASVTDSIIVVIATNVMGIVA